MYCYTSYYHECTSDSTVCSSAMEVLMKTLEQLLRDRYGVAVGVAVACAGAIALYLMRPRKPAIRTSNIDLDHQSVEVEVCCLWDSHLIAISSCILLAVRSFVSNDRA